MSTSDPWVEHARFRTTCEHLRVTRGQEFIKQALQQVIQYVSLDDELHEVGTPVAREKLFSMKGHGKYETGQQCVRVKSH